MKLISMIAAAVLMCTSLNANAANNNTSLQHRYGYDAEGRITTRTAYAWNGEEWQPALQWNYSYNDNGYTVEFSRYDCRRRRFSEPTDKVVYFFTPDSSAAFVTTYQRQEPTAPFQITEDFIAFMKQKERQPHELIAKNH